jgi:hypothetical protein
MALGWRGTKTVFRFVPQKRVFYLWSTKIEFFFVRRLPKG